MRTPLLLVLALLLPQAAPAGPTMAIWTDTGAGLDANLTTQTGQNFTIVVTLDSDGSDALAAEFVITDVRDAFPGVFLLETKKINDTVLDLGQNDVGEYMMAFMRCAPADDRIEMVRLTYADFTGAIGGRSALLTLRGFQIGDSQPSSFNGSPGFVACDETTSYAAEMGGNENEGALCINCFEPPETEATVTDLKSRF